jgi:hypothetical protein
MQWLKANMNLVITGAVALLAITGVVLGVVMSDVAPMMQTDQAVLSGVQSVKAVNPRVLDAAKKQAQANLGQVDKVVKQLEAMGNHQPLVNEVFPKVDPSNLAAPYAFKTKFKEKQVQLLAMLHAKDAPSKDDIDREREIIKDNEERAKRMSTLGTDPSGARSRGGRSNARPGAASGTLLTGAAADPNIRASVKRAHEIYCYSSLAALDQRPSITEATRAPVVEDMWYAQMAIWVEEDVLAGLAKVNKDAADKLPEKQRWVGYLPVKRLSNIWVGNYVPPTGQQAKGSQGQAGSGPPPGDASQVFTQRGTLPDVDVIQVALELVVDAQALPLILDEVCAQGFYTPLNVTYQAVSPKMDTVGYIYGSGPVVAVRVELEGCYLRGKYTKWMPETVVAAIREGKAGSSDSGAKTGGGR